MTTLLVGAVEAHRRGIGGAGAGDHGRGDRRAVGGAVLRGGVESVAGAIEDRSYAGGGGSSRAFEAVVRDRSRACRRADGNSRAARDGARDRRRCASSHRKASGVGQRLCGERSAVQGDAVTRGNRHGAGVDPGKNRGVDGVERQQARSRIDRPICRQSGRADLQTGVPGRWCPAPSSAELPAGN